MSNLELRLLSAEEMNKVPQPDGVVWPHDSFCICAFDEQGKLKGRVGMIAIPHMEGLWVSHDQLATGLAEGMVAKLEEIMRSMGRGAILTFVFNKANGLREELDKNKWKDLDMSVFAKEL